MVITMEFTRRTELLLGTEAIIKLKEATVLILGLGGVGGYVVESLIRTGLGHIILVDYDYVEETNKNRQLIALTSTVGRKKTELWKERIFEINPDCQVDVFDQKVSKETVMDLFQCDIDFVIDACDTLVVKEELIRVCTGHHIPFLTVTGTACKMDPRQLEIVELQKTTYDPIAKKLRKMVTTEHIKGKVMTVSSREPLFSKTTQELPSAIFVPATAGILCANYVVKELLGDRK